jgi:thiamine biosynthesis protein ThiS
MQTTDVLLITVNGSPREIAAGSTVSDLLESFGLHAGLVVVEHNREILPRDRVSTTEIRSGDLFELVHFVGGG